MNHGVFDIGGAASTKPMVMRKRYVASDVSTRIHIQVKYEGQQSVLNVFRGHQGPRKVVPLWLE